MNDGWIEGRFEGTYEGERLDDDGGAARGRRFSFRLRSGAVLDATPVDGPFERDPATETPDEIRQDRVGEIRLTVPVLEIDRSDTSLFDVRIVDWRLSHGAESKRRSHGRIVGRVRARLLPGAPPPVPEELDEAPDLETTAFTELETHDAALELAEPPRRARVAPRVATGELAHPASTEVEAPDADLVYDRLWFIASVIAALSAALAIRIGCGERLAWLWLAAIGTGILLRYFARDAIRAQTGGQTALATLVVGSQLVLWLEPLAWGASLWCTTPTQWQLGGLGGAVLAASLLRRRIVFATTALVWTATVCLWCSAMNGACVAPAAAFGERDPSSLETPPPASTTPHAAPPRTSPDGHWPVMPGLRPGGGGGGGTGLAGQPGFTRRGATGGSAAGSGGDRWSGAPGARAPNLDALAAGSGLAASAGSSTRANDQAITDSPVASSGEAASRLGAASDRTEAPAPPDAAPRSPQPRGSGASTTRGGWVAADHREASGRAELISLEHANRVPGSFFDSGGERRVYVPTDAIFEPGSADVRATGALALGRVAALLELEPERRKLLVVHTDVGAGLDVQQRLSDRRAASVRDWLQSRGHVEGDRFEVVGAGGAYPLVPPDGSYAAQAPNRRIEIDLID